MMYSMLVEVVVVVVEWSSLVVCLSRLFRHGG